MEAQQLYDDTNNYFLTLCGIPGSGKSTLSGELVERPNTKLYCYDTIMHNSLEKPENVRAWILTSIKDDLQAGYNVVLDDSNILIKSRAEVLTAIEECQSQKILVVMNTPLDICLSRNTKRKQRLPNWVIEHMHRKYQPPSLHEGWDAIWYVQGVKK